MPEIKWVLLHTPRAAAIPHTHTHTKQQLFDWNIMLGENYIYYNYTWHFKPQYRKLLSTFWTVSSAKDTNNKSGAHLSYASVPSSDMPKAAKKHARPPRNWTIFHTPLVTSDLHEEAAALMARLQIYPTKSNVKEFGIGMPRVQQTANIPKYPKSILAWNHIRINEHLQPQLASRSD